MLDSEGFSKYLEETQNTICGRHPIAILLKVGVITLYILTRPYNCESSVDKDSHCLECVL